MSPESKSESVDNLETRQEWLNTFLNRLWDASIRTTPGKTRVTLNPLGPQEVFISPSKLPFLEVEVGSQIARGIKSWKEAAKRLLVITKESQKKMSLIFYDEGIAPYAFTLRYGKELENAIELKYTNIHGVVDPDIANAKTALKFPPDPEKGKPNLRFRVIEMLPDSRRNLLRAVKALTPIGRQNLDQGILEWLRQSQQQAQQGENGILRDLLNRVESTPLTVVELIGRVTFYDTSRKVPQPINIAGIKITETLNGKVRAERLVSSKGFDTWEEMPPDIALTAGAEYEANYPVIDFNLNRLTRSFTTPSRPLK